MTAPNEAGPSWSRGTNPVANPSFEAPPTPSPADMPSTQPAAAAPTEQGDPNSTGTLSEESKAMADLRKENASWRTKLRAQEEAATALKTAQETQAAESASLKDMLTKLQQVLNPDSNTPPDPAKLTEQLTAAQAETAKVVAEKDRMIRELTVRASLPAAMAKANAKPGLTEKVLIADGVLGKLDPSAPSFVADLESAIAAAVEADPDLKIAPAAKPHRSGAEIPGRSGGSDQLTREQMKGMSSAEITKALGEGKFQKLLSGGG